MSDNFWIDISLQDDKSEKKLLEAIGALQEVHIWVVNTLNKHFIRDRKISPYAELRKEFNKHIRKEELWRYTQRYSLERAAEKTLPYYSASIRLNRDANLVPVEYGDFLEVTIKSRKVWRKYLAEGGRITTIYGTIFMEGDWKKILRKQAGKIPLDLFPYLWHSVTIRKMEDGWKIKFNHHLANSPYGERAKLELEKDFPDGG